MDKMLQVPRQFTTIVFLLFNSLLLLFSFLMLIPTIMSLINWSPVDFCIGLVLSLPPLLLGLLVIHLLRKRIIWVVVNAKQGVLITRKNKRKDETYDLHHIKNFVLTELIFPIPGLKKIEINAESYDGEITKLFSDDLVVFEYRWICFAEKLANFANKSLNEVSLIEKMSGKLSPK